MRFAKNPLRYEKIYSLMYIINGICMSLIMTTSPTYGYYFNKIKDLHYKIDELFKQLHFPIDYSPVMTLAALVQCFVYSYLFTYTSYVAYEFFF